MALLLEAATRPRPRRFSPLEAPTSNRPAPKAAVLEAKTSPLPHHRLRSLLLSAPTSNRRSPEAAVLQAAIWSCHRLHLSLLRSRTSNRPAPMAAVLEAATRSCHRLHSLLLGAPTSNRPASYASSVKTLLIPRMIVPSYLALIARGQDTPWGTALPPQPHVLWTVETTTCEPQTAEIMRCIEGYYHCCASVLMGKTR